MEPQDGTANDLLKWFTAPELLGIKSKLKAASLVSSDESEGLGSWTEQDEARWAKCLVEGQDETRHQAFVIDELLRWREHPRYKGVHQYRVAWKKQSIYACTWESAASFDKETLEDFWARKRGRPDHVPMPNSDDEPYLCHESDTDFPSFHHLNAGQGRVKAEKMRIAWRKDKRDLRFVKQLRREDREAQKLLATSSTALMPYCPADQNKDVTTLIATRIIRRIQTRNLRYPHPRAPRKRRLRDAKKDRDRRPR
ncbi:hypothetical protein CF326_g7925 [Tilletia indica]|nr:hypothetical protein CF326_g7925 [Tilletia indica]